MVFHPFLFPDAFSKKQNLFFSQIFISVFLMIFFHPFFFADIFKERLKKTFDQLFLNVIECIIVDSVIMYFNRHAPGILPGGQLDSN